MQNNQAKKRHIFVGSIFEEGYDKAVKINKFETQTKLISDDVARCPMRTCQYWSAKNQNTFRNHVKRQHREEYNRLR